MFWDHFPIFQQKKHSLFKENCQYQTRLYFFNTKNDFIIFLPSCWWPTSCPGFRQMTASLNFQPTNARKVHVTNSKKKHVLLKPVTNSCYHWQFTDTIIGQVEQQTIGPENYWTVTEHKLIRQTILSHLNIRSDIGAQNYWSSWPFVDGAHRSEMIRRWLPPEFCRVNREKNSKRVREWEK